MKFVPFVGLWTLAHFPTRPREWSLTRKFREIQKAGFESVCARLDAGVASLIQQHGLQAIGMVFPDSPAEFAQLLRVQKECGATRIVVQLGSLTTSPLEAAKQWVKLEQTAEDLELIVSLETHRGTVTETPEKVFALAESYERLSGRVLRLTWDFSHLGMAKHLRTGQFVERLLARPELVQASDCFLFRPFNSHHAQLPVTHRGALTPETQDYLEFAQEVMHLWKAAPKNADRTFYACPSLGPKGGYALSNFPPVWGDAVVLAKELAKCWKRAR